MTDNTTVYIHYTEFNQTDADAARALLLHCSVSVVIVTGGAAAMCTLYITDIIS